VGGAEDDIPGPNYRAPGAEGVQKTEVVAFIRKNILEATLR